MVIPSTGVDKYKVPEDVTYMEDFTICDASIFPD
jgi:hypothetical protein